MPIQFQCECGQNYSVREELGGKKTRCKACDELLTIPLGKISKTSTKSKTVAKPKVTPAEDEEDEDEESPARSAQSKSKADGKSKKKKKSDDKKSKKSKSSAGPSKKTLVGILVAVGVLGVAGIGFLLVNVVGGSGGKTAAVAEAPAIPRLSPVQHELGLFTIDFPDAWTVTQGGGSGGIPPFANAERKGVFVAIRSDPAGTVLFASNAPMGEIPEDLKPVHLAHNLVKLKMEENFSNYKETEQVPVMTKFSEGRISEFTGKEGPFSPIKGLRATFISTNWTFKVICRCPEKEYAKQEPMFRKVIESLRRVE